MGSAATPDRDRLPPRKTEISLPQVLTVSPYVPTCTHTTEEGRSSDVERNVIRAFDLPQFGRCGSSFFGEKNPDSMTDEMNDPHREEKATPARKSSKSPARAFRVWRLCDRAFNSPGGGHPGAWKCSDFSASCAVLRSFGLRSRGRSSGIVARAALVDRLSASRHDRAIAGRRSAFM
jgi:hypothetical protein